MALISALHTVVLVCGRVVYLTDVNTVYGSPSHVELYFIVAQAVQSAVHAHLISLALYVPGLRLLTICSSPRKMLTSCKCHNSQCVGKGGGGSD